MLTNSSAVGVFEGNENASGLLIHVHTAKDATANTAMPTKNIGSIATHVNASRRNLMMATVQCPIALGPLIAHEHVTVAHPASGSTPSSLPTGP